MLGNHHHYLVLKFFITPGFEPRFFLPPGPKQLFLPCLSVEEFSMGARTCLPLGVQPAGGYVAIRLSTMPSQDLGLLAPVLDCFLCLEPSLPPPSSLPPVTMRGISKGRSCQKILMWKRTELTGQDWLHGIVRAPETSYA